MRCKRRGADKFQKTFPDLFRLRLAAQHLFEYAMNPKRAITDDGASVNQERLLIHDLPVLHRHRAYFDNPAATSDRQAGCFHIYDYGSLPCFTHTYLAFTYENPITRARHNTLFEHDSSLLSIIQFVSVLLLTTVVTTNQLCSIALTG